MSGAVEVIRCRESSDYLHFSRGVRHGSGTRGWTGVLSKLWDKNTLCTERSSEGEVEEAMGETSTMYVVRKRGRLTMDLGVVMTRQNFGYPCSFLVLSWFVVAWQGRTEVDTSVVELSEVDEAEWR